MKHLKLLRLAPPLRLGLACWLACAALMALAAAPAHAAPVPDTVAQRALACTACHRAQDQETPQGYVPRIAGKPAGYLLEQMRNFRDGRRTHDGMARLMEHLDDRFLAELAAHFAALAPSHRSTGAPAVSAAVAQRAQRWVLQGDSALGIPACSACHGTALTGVQPNVPGLLGLPGDYLMAQLGAWRQGLRHAREPDCMARMARALPSDDVPAIARWLAAQPLPILAAPAAAPPQPWPQRCGAHDEPAAAVKATAPPPPGAAASNLVEQGRELALIGNCAGCHTARGGKAYAGGDALPTPFGTAYAGNLTPDDTTGLGRWTADDFWAALHHGRGRDGRALVPAFPYTSYTHVTRAHSDALWAYLRSLAPVQQPKRPHALRFPYGTQLALRAWQWLFFSPADPLAEAQARSALTPSQTRGAYWVQGLGHCGACHAPRNALGAPGAQLTGGEMPQQGWYAPSLHRVASQALGTAANLEEQMRLLKTGQTAHAAALGPMAGVVAQSTQHWPDNELRAVVDYLQTLPPQPGAAPAPPASPAVLQAGQRIYEDRCADCHGKTGQGAAGAGSAVYPALAGNATVLHPNPRNLVQVLRHGGFAPTTAGQPRPYGMPPMMLSDADTAAVLTYIRQSWGQRAAAVSELDVLRLR